MGKGAQCYIKKQDIMEWIILWIIEDKTWNIYSMKLWNYPVIFKAQLIIMTCDQPASLLSNRVRWFLFNYIFFMKMIECFSIFDFDLRADRSESQVGRERWLLTVGPQPPGPRVCFYVTVPFFPGLVLLYATTFRHHIPVCQSRQTSQGQLFEKQKTKTFFFMIKTAGMM